MNFHRDERGFATGILFIGFFIMLGIIGVIFFMDSPSQYRSMESDEFRNRLFAQHYSTFVKSSIERFDRHHIKTGEFLDHEKSNDRIRIMKVNPDRVQIHFSISDTDAQTVLNAVVDHDTRARNRAAQMLEENDTTSMVRSLLVDQYETVFSKNRIREERSTILSNALGMTMRDKYPGKTFFRKTDSMYDHMIVLHPGRQ